MEIIIANGLYVSALASTDLIHEVRLMVSRLGFFIQFVFSWMGVISGWPPPR